MGPTIQRYVLLLTARPFFGTLLILLPALLLERLLRLFALIANNSVPADSVGRMLLDLVPHYFGLALPIALFIGIHAVVAQLSTENELDAMQNSGLSLAWISRPFFVLGLAAAIFGVILYGYLEPLSRYGYRVALQEATEGSWNAIIPAGAMTKISDNLVVTSDGADRYGNLRHIFLYQRQADGTQIVTTGRTGSLALTPDNEIVLAMRDGSQLQIDPDATVKTLQAASNVTDHTALLRMAAFDPRGSDDPEELTLGELWAGSRQTLSRNARAAELHMRLIRALSLAVVPFLAVPFGLAAKRARRGYGIVLGVFILVLYYHAVELAGALGSAGLIDPRPLLWANFALFSGFAVYMFWQANRRSHAGPLDRVFGGLAGTADGLAKYLRRRRIGVKQ
jgi:lipopolysaccharide export system permease protein